jgi:hypothetical protein
MIVRKLRFRLIILLDFRALVSGLAMHAIRR